MTDNELTAILVEVGAGVDVHLEEVINCLLRPFLQIMKHVVDPLESRVV
jgi:hypothetical protein